MADHEQARRDVAAVVPHRADDLARLRVLSAGGASIVTVVGKYNHGKSRLLNELMGQDAFSVADRRETTELSGREHGGVHWLDAPGLDADVGTEDDRKALQAAWLSSDIRLVVHAAKEGELDAKELALLAELRADESRTRRQALLVLTQIDQMGGEADLENVRHAVAAQAPGMPLHPVSATRHRKGAQEGKQLLLEKSGIPGLRAALDAALARVPRARAHEAALLFGEIGGEVRGLRAERAAALEALRRTQRGQRQDFDLGLKAVIDKVGGDIVAMLEALGPDHAIVPDSARDAYAITAGKRERAHIQMAYSRACIEIDSFLAGHGALELPAQQQTVARSLNSAMVAVLGVSVKFRKDLRRMFGEVPGRERMRGEFTRYYELSADRQALAARILDAESALAASDQASAALSSLEAGA